MTGDRDEEEDKKDAIIIQRYINIAFVVLIIGVLITTLVMFLAGGIESIGLLNSPYWIIEEYK